MSNIVRHKGDTIAKMCWNHHHEMLLRDLVGPRFTSWNAFLLRLAPLQLAQGTNEFR
jgi:hypothetical protein